AFWVLVDECGADRICDRRASGDAAVWIRLRYVARSRGDWRGAILGGVQSDGSGCVLRDFCVFAAGILGKVGLSACAGAAEEICERFEGGDGEGGASKLAECGLFMVAESNFNRQ